MRARWSGFDAILAVSADKPERDITNEAKPQMPTAIETDFNQRRYMGGLLNERRGKAGWDQRWENQPPSFNHRQSGFATGPPLILSLMTFQPVRARRQPIE